MADNYFIEYTHYIHELERKLMKIQLRFNECLETIRKDINLAVLSFEEGEELLNQRMDRYYEQYDSKYTLSKSDVEFIQTYADVDNNGQVLATFLKRELLDKKDKLTAMLESIRIFGYLDNLSEEDARLSVKVAMFEHYNTQVKSLETKMNNLLQMYGEKEKHSRRYLELQEQRDKLLKALSVIEIIEQLPKEKFDRIVSQFYDVDKKYYDWYLKMQIKQEYEEGTIYQDHCVTLGNIDNSGETILDASNELLALNEQLQKTHTALFNIMIGISKFDINKYLEQQEKHKKRLFKKEELNNREMLFEIFLNLLSINGLKTYIEEIYGNSDNSVNLNEAFNKYFNKKYGEETLYVEPYTFINDFREVVALCYKDKLEDIMNKINIQNIKINSNTTLMCDNIRIGMNQASLQKEIREQYPAKRDELMIIGFTMEELERIYTNLKEFIGNGFSFGTDDEELFLRKV